jgi:hypothetical protein
MSGNIHPLPQYASMVWCSVKHRDNFTFTLLLPNGNGVNKPRRISNTGHATPTVKLKMDIEFWSANLKGRNHFTDLHIAGRMKHTEMEI